MKNIKFIRTILAMVLCSLMACSVLPIMASAAARMDDWTLSRINALKEDETIYISIDLDDEYMMPDFDRKLLKKENRMQYIATPDHPADPANDPATKLFIACIEKAYTILDPYMEIVRKDRIYTVYPGSAHLGGFATKENIMKIAEFPEIIEIHVPSTYTHDNDTVKTGDANGDGRVSAADARIALRMSAKLVDAELSAFAAVDLNGDGMVTASEARTILRISARLEAL